MSAHLVVSPARSQKDRPARFSGKDGKDATLPTDAELESAAKPSTGSDSEPHLHIGGRDLGTLSAARSYCDAVEADVENGGGTGGHIDNENRANCGFSNGDLDCFLAQRRARGDYDQFVY